MSRMLQREATEDTHVKEPGLPLHPQTPTFPDASGQLMPTLTRRTLSHTGAAHPHLLGNHSQAAQ